MSLFGSMKTAVSGMNAQANRLSTVSDNIANVNTTGYKGVSTAFSTLVLPSTAGNYNSGSVQTITRQSISQAGGTVTTTSSTDLSINGAGFFIVQGNDGMPVLTRAGDFQVDKDGNLTNSAGFKLMGYSYASGAPAVVVNGFDSLQPINVLQNTMTAIASTKGSWTGNLKGNAPVVSDPTKLPSVNGASTTADTKKLSLVSYDKLGNSVMYDYYFTKTSETKDAGGAVTGSTWEVAVFRHDDAATGGSSSFPYSSAAVSTASLSFDGNGKFVSQSGTDITDPKTGLTLKMDYSTMTQLAGEFSVSGQVDGQAAVKVNSVKIGTDGVVSAVYSNGTTKSLYQIPLATVPSPDNLTMMSGNVYTANAASGVTITAYPNTSGLGSIVSGSLENSNVDLASELTVMIESQRSYTANSKVFQTGADIMDVLVNLKR